MHPILYLAVAPGLKFLPDPQETLYTNNNVTHRSTQSPMESDTDTFALPDCSPTNETQAINTEQSTFNSGNAQQRRLSHTAEFLSQIERAREFVMSWMKGLQTVLPKRPITMIIDFIKVSGVRAILLKTRETMSTG